MLERCSLNIWQLGPRNLCILLEDPLNEISPKFEPNRTNRSGDMAGRRNLEFESQWTPDQNSATAAKEHALRCHDYGGRAHIKGCAQRLGPRLGAQRREETPRTVFLRTEG